MPSASTPKLWLVTGASQGLGLQIALAALAIGHRVLATARDIDKARKDNPEVEARGGNWLPLNVTSTDTEAAIEKAVADMGGVDVVINNAGYLLTGSVEDLTEDEMQKCISTNFLGSIRVLKGALPTMRAQRSGTILYVGSIFGFLRCPGGALYNCTKAAGDMLCETLASELAPFGIRSVIVNAGLFRTGVLRNSAMPAAGFAQHYVENTAVGKVLGTVQAMLADPEGTMPGDPEKFGKQIVEIVDASGSGQDLKKPARFFIGNDSLEMAEKKIAILQADLEASRDVGASAGFKDHGAPGVAPVADM